MERFLAETLGMTGLSALEGDGKKKGAAEPRLSSSHHPPYKSSLSFRTFAISEIVRNLIL